MDFVDPSFVDEEHSESVDRAFQQIAGQEKYKILASFSPYSIPYIAAQNGEPWSFAFIDGNHDANAPSKDAKAVIEHCAKDAIVVFHDLTSPDVTAGFNVFKAAGWNTRILNTMQILGIAWRGKIELPNYIADENTPIYQKEHLLQD